MLSVMTSILGGEFVIPSEGSPLWFVISQPWRVLRVNKEVFRSLRSTFESHHKSDVLHKLSIAITKRVC